MSDPQPGYIRPNPIPQRLSPGSDISGPQAEFQRGWSDMSGPDLDMFGFLTPQRLDFLRGAIKGPPHASLAREATQFTL
jgi:hypothetical protein